MSVTITSWLNGQLVKIHLPERSFSQGRLVLSKTITSLLNGQLVKIHLPEVLSISQEGWCWKSITALARGFLKEGMGVVIL